MNCLSKKIVILVLLLNSTFLLAGGYFSNPVELKDVLPKDRICFAMYTVHNQTLKMVVQFYPLKDSENRQVFLEVLHAGKWQRIAEETIRENYYTKGGRFEAKAWNLRFRVENWNHQVTTKYRVVALGGVANYYGEVRKDPVDKEEIIVAAFTGNSRHDKGTRKEMVRLVKQQNPDLLFFSGDQVYHHWHHLREWLIFGAEFGEITRNIPTVSIPDDHDVGQGNLWGANGKKSTHTGGADGGFIQTSQYINEVQFAQTGNLPDPYETSPIQQNIGVYYTSLNVGGVDFAIIEDRKFKTGPLELFPEIKGRPDHPGGRIALQDLNHPKAKLLGDRQLSFLKAWSKEWKNSSLKCVLSATIFCQGHTSQKIDLDTNGWPQTGRNKALEEIRKGFAFMLAGDQHLATVVQHGIVEFGDAGFSYSVPSVVNHYPRVWQPKNLPKMRIESPFRFAGKYLDGLGNKITMHCYANPGESQPPLATKSKHATRATGHGIVRFNKKTRKITMECWPRGAQFNAGPKAQYPGWPMTIQQEDNYGRQAVAYLPTLIVSGMVNPVVQVINEKSGETVYTLRINGQRFQPKVFAEGLYTIIVGDQQKKNKTFNHVIAKKKEISQLKVKFKRRNL